MSVTDDLLHDAERPVPSSRTDGGRFRVARLPFIPHEDDVRGFGPDAGKGTPREVG